MEDTEVITILPPYKQMIGMILITDGQVHLCHQPWKKAKNSLAPWTRSKVIGWEGSIMPSVEAVQMEWLLKTTFLPPVQMMMKIWVKKWTSLVIPSRKDIPDQVPKDLLPKVGPITDLVLMKMMKKVGLLNFDEIKTKYLIRISYLPFFSWMKFMPGFLEIGLLWILKKVYIYATKISSK